MLLSGETIEGNLLRIADLFHRSKADVIALQEADAESIWSGQFNHVALLAELSGFPCYVHGLHANSRLYDYGTALISRHAFVADTVHHFQPSWPTTTKGFVVATVAWNPSGALASPYYLKLVSVHLDFSRRAVRRSQIDEMERVLSGLNGPLVVMGDFNSDWSREDSSVRLLAQRLDLHAWAPDLPGMETYERGEARLDWILLSRELRFERHAVYPDVVSDHLAVVADISLTRE
jgi:endonuclease/exonuclease/phosphatase family metal-dependent hydrolase